VPYPPWDDAVPGEGSLRSLPGTAAVPGGDGHDSALVQRPHRPGTEAAPPWGGGDSLLVRCRVSPGVIIFPAPPLQVRGAIEGFSPAAVAWP
jgi:hypothetical protein